MQVYEPPTCALAVLSGRADVSARAQREDVPPLPHLPSPPPLAPTIPFATSFI